MTGSVQEEIALEQDWFNSAIEDLMLFGKKNPVAEDGCYYLSLYMQDQVKSMNGALQSSPSLSVIFKSESHGPEQQTQAFLGF